jgi:hypothetical protein
MTKDINANNWKEVGFTGIVLQEGPWAPAVIIPVCNDNGAAGYRKFDQTLLEWTTLDVNEVVAEVDAAWANPAVTVDILTHDLPIDEETGRFDPFRLY